MAVPTIDGLARFSNITAADLLDRLPTFLSAALSTISQRCGPPGGTVVEEQAQACHGRLVLAERPVQSVTSVTTHDGDEIDLEGVKISKRAAVVTLRRPISGEVDVVYEAGWDPYPDDLEMSVYVVADHLWETQRGRSGTFAAIHGLDDDAPVGGDASYLVLRGFALPRRAMELTRPYIKPGFA